MSFRQIIWRVVLCSSLLIDGLSLFSQTSGFNTYSHAEFLALIENTPDSIFRLENAIIQFDETTDQRFRYSTEPGGQNRSFSSTDTLVINKSLMLSNVHFDHSERRQPRAFHHIRFNKDVFMINTSSVIFMNSDFRERLVIISTESMSSAIDFLDGGSRLTNISTSIFDSKLRKGISIDMGTTDEKTRSQIRLERSEIWPSNLGRGSRLSSNGLTSFNVRNNRFYGSGRVSLLTEQTDDINSMRFYLEQ